MPKHWRWQQKFVKAESDFCKNERSGKSTSTSVLNGNEAKHIYDEIVNTPSAAPSRKNSCSSIKTQPKKRPVILSNNAIIFKLAQENKTKDMQLLIESNVDINVTDSYGWTPLMCAVCASARDVVALLLKSGANKYVKDKAGTDAFILAKRNNSVDIINCLTNSCLKNEKTPNVGNISTYFCDLCNSTFNVSKKRHETSVTHLLKEKKRKPNTFYKIPETNKGFQLLVRQGWDREQGLGPDGTGRKFPVRANPKTNKLGIGAGPIAKKSKEKIPDTSQSISIRSAKSEKLFERNFRREFM